MTKKGIYIVFLFLLCFRVHCQRESDSIAINFHAEFNKLPLELGKKYISDNKDTLSIETFKLYISNIQVRYEDQSVFIRKNSFHLLDFTQSESFQIPISQKSNKRISEVAFNVGIDSTTSNSGALNGDLDPAKGMYWAWQSGYINMKIEGKSLSCSTRKNEFHFHIGGYLQPYYALREVRFSLNKKADSDIKIGIDLAQFLSELKLKETNSVMIPGKEAMKLADVSTKMFYLQ